jgi:4-hydroxy-tetrahydrodipicolinate synthase
MNRREFARAVGIGAIALPSLARASASDRKTWAQNSFKGLENFVLPSFTPDFNALDEDGIRNDVRHAIRQGFVATTVLGLGTTRTERNRALELAVVEAAGKILIGTTVGGRTAAEDLEQAQRAGVSHTLLTLDSTASTEDEIYQSARRLIDSSTLSFVLYAQPHAAFRKFDPSGIPVGVLNRLVDLPNVIAVKLTQVIDLAAAYEIAERLSDRALIGVVELSTVPVMANKYHLQWSGEWAVDAVQSPSHPYAVEFLDLVSRHRIGEAMKVYWKMQPALDAFFELQAPTLPIGGHPWSHIKYYQWATGGNGGVLRDLKQRPDQVPILDARGRDAIKKSFKTIGIEPIDLPDEAFIVGNAAYAKGVRIKDLASTPQYTI